MVFVIRIAKDEHNGAEIFWFGDLRWDDTARRELITPDGE